MLSDNLFWGRAKILSLNTTKKTGEKEDRIERLLKHCRTGKAEGFWRQKRSGNSTSTGQNGWLVHHCKRKDHYNHFKQGGDEGDLDENIPFLSSLQLSFANHIHDLISL